MKEIIGIIGYGVVGKAIAKVFKLHYTVLYYDKYLKSDTFIRLSRMAGRDIVAVEKEE